MIFGDIFQQNFFLFKEDDEDSKEEDEDDEHLHNISGFFFSILIKNEKKDVYMLLREIKDLNGKK